MRIHVRLFAGLREAAGWSERELEGVERVADVWPALELGREPEGLLYAVNREYADRGRELRDGDEVALIPPVSGGAFLLSDEPLSLDRVVDEVRWLRDVHQESGWPMAVIGSADLFSEDAPEIMRRQAALTPLVRGTRQQLHWHERPEFRFAGAPDRMKDPVFRKNIGALADLGWLFELQVFPEQMPDAARLAAAFPDVTFVLVHAGMLIGHEYLEPWRAGMSVLAERPNIVVKLTGQGTFVHRVDPGLISLVAAEVIDRFGVDRAMFGTNFPVEKIWTAMPPLVDAWKDALAHLPPAAQRAVFADNARRVYGLGD
jgi:predicted TIM-barrel fold metal-dependent hydrolase/molybdopterin converting factor small subunit